MSTPKALRGIRIVFYVTKRDALFASIKKCYLYLVSQIMNLSAKIKCECVEWKPYQFIID